MKIYTKKGDRGETSLIGGTRVTKYSHRVEANGTVDELNAYVGLIRDQAIGEGNRSVLKEIQEELLSIGSNLAADRERSRMKLPGVSEKSVTRLQKAIDRRQ